MGVRGKVAVVCAVFLVAVKLASSQVDVAPSPLPFTSPDVCSGETGEIFQSGNLSCVPCSSAYSQPSADGFSCECFANASRVAGEPLSSSAPHCSPCAENEVASANGLCCVECVSPVTFDPTAQSCTPCPSNLYVYFDVPPSSAGLPGNRTCVSCPPGTWADQSGYSCVECGLSNCSQCEQPYNSLCFPSSLPSPPSPSHSFTYYDQHFTAAVGLCRYGNQEACQLLVNLCVLQRYLRSDPACGEVVSTVSPLLHSPYYPRHGADEALAVLLGQLHTPSSSSSSSSQGTNELPLMIATFALNGTFLGLHDVSDQLLICRDLPPCPEAVWQVGVWYEVDCKVGVASLSRVSADPIFYDLYWRDRSSMLHPVPVVPSDYVDSVSGEEVNEGGERGAWQLVTRFLLSEAISSSPRHARHMTLRVELDGSGRVFTPFLLIEYAEWEPDLDTTDTLRAMFSVVYWQDVMSFNVTLSVFVVVMAAMVGVVCGVRVNGFIRRTGDLCCTLPTYVFMVAEFSGLLSSGLFVILSLSCTVILILYKGQTLFVYTLPFGSQLLIFQLLLPLALLARVIQVLYLVGTQSSIDIFLLDWEKPRLAPPSTNQITEQPNGVTPPIQGGVVSIWRTIFVANEWNELQCVRRGLSPLTSLITALLLLQVTGLRHLAEHDPTGHVTTSPWRYSAPHSPLLRFSLTALVFTTIAVSMRLYMFLFHERFIEHKINQFIDLCSVSNVSVFIMWRRCYGYYIEGRSVHGQADTDMRGMIGSLVKEQEDMCGRRGLMPDSDLQTFQIALTQQFRTQYDKLFTSLQPQMPEVHANDIPRPPEGVVSEARIGAYEEMNHFLSSFISHNLRGLDYTTRSKVLLERLLEVELHRPEERCVFYEDPSPSLSQTLFYGQEWSLWQLEVLLFAFVDMLATDYVLAAVITTIVAVIVALLKRVFSARNLANKTLIDKRFLI